MKHQNLTFYLNKNLNKLLVKSQICHDGFYNLLFHQWPVQTKAFEKKKLFTSGMPLAFEKFLPGFQKYTFWVYC